MSKQQFQQPALPEIDRNLAVWQAYLNVVNSFNQLSTVSVEGIMVSAPNTEAFAWRLGILDAQLAKERKEDAEFKKGKYQSFPEILRNGYDDADLFEYWERLDQLMQSTQLFKVKTRAASI